MIFTAIYCVWFATFCLGFYTVEVATKKYGFVGRLAAYIAWVFWAMATVLCLPVLLHELWGERLGVDWKFTIGQLVGIVFNVVFFIVGCHLARARG